MPVSANGAGNLRTQNLQKNLTTAIDDGIGLTEKQKDNVKKWATYYRRNWELYAEEVLGVKLYPTQKIKIHMMGISHEYWDISTRGSAKSFLTALGALIAFQLYPYAEIIITSSTIPQAAKLVENKMRDEIIKKLSPYLLYLYEKEYIIITKSSTDGAYKIENKLNGATIQVLPCLESSRGSRATLTIYEEVRLLKKSLIDSVFVPMSHARQAKYLLKEEYNTKRWQEPARSIYITSARYGWEWFWKAYMECVKQYYLSRHETYIPIAQDIFSAIEDGSRTWADYRKAKKQMTSTDFLMEILNIMLQQDEGAFFELKSFNESQVLEEPFKPPTILEIISGGYKPKPKDVNEVRLVVVDFAFANTTTSQKNDNTILMCMSLHWKNNHFERNVDYIEGWEASDTLGSARRIKELKWDYDADYVVMDNRSGGEVLYNTLTLNQPHEQRGYYWDSRGFTVAYEDSLQVVPNTKLDDLRQRTVDKNAIPCIIPVIASDEFNSVMWIELKKSLEMKNIKLLISTQNKQEDFENSGEYFKMTSEEYGRALAPFGQTDLMIEEAINLTAEYRANKVRLIEPKSRTKDRIVVLAYGNYIATKIENLWQQRFTITEDEVNDFDLVF